MQPLFAGLMELLTKMTQAVFTSLSHNWLPLSLAILMAAVMTVYVDAEKLKRALLRNPNVSIWGSVAVGAFTPLCACGTMAVMLGMLTTALPWGPIMAFLTSSPLMSPDGFIMTAGIISLEYAIALTLASIFIGLGAGYATHLIEKKSTFLNNQTRFAREAHPQTCGGCAGPEPQVPPAQTCGCAASVPRSQPMQAHGGGTAASIALSRWDSAVVCCAERPITELLWFASIVQTFETIFNAVVGGVKKVKWRALADAVMKIGVKQILLYYAMFVAVGFLINSFVPTSLIMALFSADNPLAVPIAALIGLPLYVTTESSIPLITALTAQGASGGAMLAFMITGPGTSAWVIAGISAILKRRAICLYIFFILIGGVLSGYGYELFLILAR